MKIVLAAFILFSIFIFSSNSQEQKELAISSDDLGIQANMVFLLYGLFRSKN